jgi:NADH:ubiquinone oxidoreductase subunit F (NADH-binding)
VARGGYQALRRIIESKMPQEQVIAEVKIPVCAAVAVRASPPA